MMPDLRRNHYAVGAVLVGSGSPGPALQSLSGGYDAVTRRSGTVYGDMTPRQIADRIHAEIADKSPGGAVLVASYNRIRYPESTGPEPSVVETGRALRQARYDALRSDRVGKFRAAEMLGLSKATAYRYEAAYQAAGHE